MISMANKLDLTPDQCSDDYAEAGEACMEYLESIGKSDVDLCTRILDWQLTGEKFSETLRRIDG